MTKEEKQLLLRDLCARLPYNTIVLTVGYGAARKIKLDHQIYSWVEQDTFRIMPYLFPLSSMTDEQKEMYCRLQQKVIYNSKGLVTEDVMNYVNWCYENHLDVNDLIPNGLGIDATGKNIY